MHSNSISPELKADIIEVHDCLKCPYFFKCAKENLVRIEGIDMKARKVKEIEVITAPIEVTVVEIAIRLEVRSDFFLYKECNRGILDSGHAIVIYYTHRVEAGIVGQEILELLVDNYYYAEMKTSSIKIELVIPISEWYKINATYTTDQVDVLEIVDMLNKLYDVVYNQGRRIVLWK